VELIDFTYQQPELSPGYLLWQLHMVWQRKLNQILIPFNLTHAQFVLLTSINKLSSTYDSISQSDIATVCHLDVMTVSKSIRLLETKKLISRLLSANDGRAFTLALTDSGLALLNNAKTAVAESDAEFFQSIGKEKKLLKLMKLQAKLLSVHTSMPNITDSSAPKTNKQKNKGK